MPFTNPIRGHCQTTPRPIPFPVSQARARSRGIGGASCGKALLPDSMDDMLAAVDDISRRINDLARELHCLGYFDDPNSDLPRAA